MWHLELRASLPNNNPCSLTYKSDNFLILGCFSGELRAIPFPIVRSKTQFETQLVSCSTPCLLFNQLRSIFKPQTLAFTAPPRHLSETSCQLPCPAKWSPALDTHAISRDVTIIETCAVISPLKALPKQHLLTLRWWDCRESKIISSCFFHC